MEAERARVRGKDAAGITEFRIFPRGGAWTLRATGLAVDAWRAEASCAESKAWCRLFQLPLSKTMSIALYEAPVAVALATMWADKMQFLYEWWIEAGRNMSCYCDEAGLARYEEPAAYRVATAHAAAHARKCVDSIRSITTVPR